MTHSSRYHGRSAMNSNASRLPVVLTCALATSSLACARLSVEKHVREGPAVPGTPGMHWEPAGLSADCTASPSRISCSVAENTSCVTARTLRFPRTLVTENRLFDLLSGQEITEVGVGVGLTVSLLAVAAGAAAVVAADRGASLEGDSEDLRVLGWIILACSSPFPPWMAIEGLRLRDREAELPDRAETQILKKERCGASPAGDVSVRLELFDGSSSTKRTDAMGHVSFATPPQSVGVVFEGQAWATLYLPDGGKREIGGPDTSLARKWSILALDLKPLAGASQDIARMLQGLLLAHLSSVDRITVFGRYDLDAVLQAELQKDLLGCNDTTCIAELGGATGADAVMHGELGAVGSKYALSLALVDTTTAALIGRSSVLVPRDGDALIDAVPRVATQLVQQLATASR